jgi:hypothetical protein
LRVSNFPRGEQQRIKKKTLTLSDGCHKGVATLLDGIGSKIDGMALEWIFTSELVPGDGHGDVVVVHGDFGWAGGDLKVGALDGLAVIGGPENDVLGFQDCALAKVEVRIRRKPEEMAVLWPIVRVIVGVESAFDRASPAWQQREKRVQGDG